ncbi:MAG: hypothetical protein Q9218_002630 [Villophora microphyllina]
MFDQTRENWEVNDVDTNLQTALRGGIDEYGVFWEGQRDQEPLATTMARQFWDEPDEQCTIKKPCAPPISCQNIGSYTAFGLRTLEKPLKIPWVLLASSAVNNINQQLANIFEQFQIAAASLDQDAFSIDDYYPKDNPRTDIKNSLAGLSLLFTVAGLIPTVGPSLTLAGAVTGGVATIFGNTAPADALGPQKVFAQALRIYSEGLQKSFEQFATTLFAGDLINDSAELSPTAPSAMGSNLTNLTDTRFKLTDMMGGGAWVNSTYLTDLSELNELIRMELKSRCIDALWKNRPSKMWVLFTYLDDDINTTTKCMQDKSAFQKAPRALDHALLAFNFTISSSQGFLFMLA